MLLNFQEKLIMEEELWISVPKRGLCIGNTYIKKVKGEREVSRQMAMMWTVEAKNCLTMKDTFAPSQLVLREYSQ